MYFKRLTPGNGYCLYFPNRKPGYRFEAGRRVWVGPFEQWKHIKLGQFEVKFSSEEQGDLITTAEHLECTVRADFKIVIGGREEGREERLALATITCPATRDVSETIELPFFRDWASNYCKNSIKRIVNDRSYVPLIEDANYRSETSRLIRNDLMANLETIGMILVESTVLVEPQEPKGVLATEELFQKWQDYQATIDRADIAKKKAELEKKNELDDLTKDDNIRQMKTAAEIRQEERKIDILDKERDRDKENQLRSIQEVIDGWNQEHKLAQKRMEKELKEEEKRLSEEIEVIERQHQEEKLQHEMKVLDEQQKIALRKNELANTEKAAAEIEIALERERGKVKAENIRDETLAAAEAAIKEQSLLLEKMPQIMEGANRSLERIGEMRVLNVLGSGASTGDGDIRTSGMLASLTSLPLIREVLRFVSDIEGNINENGERSLRAKKLQGSVHTETKKESGVD